jgi:hypothetical protein
VPTATRIDLPRPAIIAVLGVLVLAVTFLVTKAGDDNGSVAAPATSAASTTTQTTATGTGTTTSTATTTTPKPAKPQQPAVTPGPGLPPTVARALNANKVVVLFFYTPVASDDQATKAAIRAVREAGGGGGRVALFQDFVARISRYRRVTGSVGISQTPAMVVIDRNRKAELLQGYLDSGTIRQTVRDAL